MLIATSILKILNQKNKVNNIINSKTDMIHLDIMDGEFVNNTTFVSNELFDLLKSEKNIDVHLMVKDVIKYVDKYSLINPEYITFHYEVSDKPEEIIQYIKKLGIKAGISIKPNTDIHLIDNLLNDVDLVLIMSVEPGFGGQKFIESSIDKINYLYNLRDKYSFKIEVDGGINLETIDLVKCADIAVCGSYITDSDDYNERINNLKNKVT